MTHAAALGLAVRLPPLRPQSPPGRSAQSPLLLQQASNCSQSELALGLLQGAAVMQVVRHFSLL